jgi:hypothetical protein
MAAKLLIQLENIGEIMPKLIVKPAINFLSTDSDSELSVRVGAILQGMAGNPDYPSPLPPLDTISAAKGAFTTAIAEAALLGLLLTATKNARRAELVSLVRQLASYVTVACGGDLAVLLGSNFPIHKPTRDAVGRLDKPQMPRLTHGPRSGEINARTKPVRGVFIYNWKLTLASDPATILQTTQTTGASGSFSGLTPGERYCVCVNAVGAAGPADFSGPASLMSL